VAALLFFLPRAHLFLAVLRFFCSILLFYSVITSHLFLSDRCPFTVSLRVLVHFDFLFEHCVCMKKTIPLGLVIAWRVLPGPVFLGALWWHSGFSFLPRSSALGIDALFPDSPFQVSFSVFPVKVAVLFRICGLSFRLVFFICPDWTVFEFDSRISDRFRTFSFCRRCSSDLCLFTIRFTLAPVFFPLRLFLFFLLRPAIFVLTPPIFFDASSVRCRRIAVMVPVVFSRLAFYPVFCEERSFPRLTPFFPARGRSVKSSQAPSPFHVFPFFLDVLLFPGRSRFGPQILKTTFDNFLSCFPPPVLCLFCLVALVLPRSLPSVALFW